MKRTFAELTMDGDPQVTLEGPPRKKRKLEEGPESAQQSDLLAVGPSFSLHQNSPVLGCDLDMSMDTFCSLFGHMNLQTSNSKNKAMRLAGLRKHLLDHG